MNALPLSYSYNLARLGQAGDEVRIESDEAQCAAIAQFSNIVAVARFVGTVALKKASPDRFVLSYRVEADVTQSCVISLAPVTAHIDHTFTRELRLTRTGRHGPLQDLTKTTDIDVSVQEEEPEDIESPHYDLAGPLLEEFFLALDPYPRCAGVEFESAKTALEAKENPFAILKSLKSST
jgi:uncharacterized metal-binding protein YceD (DUF177 family)